MGEVSLPQSGRLTQSSLSLSQISAAGRAPFILDVDQSTVLVIARVNGALIVA
jgi:hypothetical protein